MTPRSFREHRTYRLLVTLALFAGSACESQTTPAPPKTAPSLFENKSPSSPTPTPAASESPPESQGELAFTTVTAPWTEVLVHHAGRTDAKWLPEILAGGVALLDVDRNGALDILLADGGALAGETASNVGPRLLLGTATGTFEDASAAWGLTHAGYGMGIAAGDVDGDGWVDIYLTTYDGHDRLLHNDEGTGFSDVTEAWGLRPSGWSTSAAFADIDDDGDLDLYVVRYVVYDLEQAIKCWFRAIHIYCEPGMYTPLPDMLWRNDGDHFTDISVASGIAAHAAKGLAIATGDFDDDGDIDFYVADDTSRNLLLLGDGSGAFEEVGIKSGVALSELGREEASMGVAVSDSNADGRWDLAVTNFQAEPTSLYVRSQGGHYRERSDAAGIGASARARLSFGIEWLDADNDGLEDLLTANGHIADNVETYREKVGFAQRNSLYRRVGDGQFEDVSDTSGPGLLHVAVSRGLAVGDLDADGGLDYVVVNNNAQAQVVRNTTQNRGHWLSLWLEADSSRRSAGRSPIGAVVTATLEHGKLRREVRGASSYLSVSDRRVHLGLGSATQVEELEIRWPDGQVQSLGVVKADAHLHIVQGQAPVAYKPGREIIRP